MATEAGHSSKDSVEPGQVPRMFISYMILCPYTERINIVLSVKHIPSHMLNITESRGNIGDLLKKNGRKIPFLKCGDHVIYDSLMTIDFIDQQYPEPPLWNCKPAQKILDKLLIESFAKVEVAVYKLYMTTEEVKKENFEELVACLTPFEVELVKRGSKYFGGDEQNMVDVMINPWFVLMDTINPYSKGKFIFPFDAKFPKLAEWKASFSDLGVPLGYPKFLAKQIQLIKSEIFCTWYLKSLPKFNF